MSIDKRPDSEEQTGEKRGLIQLQALNYDIAAIKKLVEDGANVGTPLWLSYLFATFYISLAASAVTHEDLLLENQVSLPFLNVKLSLVAFFFIAPAIYLVVHGYILAHFVLLADKIKLLHGRLKEIAPGDASSMHELREGFRRQLPVNLFVQYLAGPEEFRRQSFSYLLWMIAWTTLCVTPIFVILLLQLQFLPYHDVKITWWHRLILIVDILLIWWLWPKIIAGHEESLLKKNLLPKRFLGFFWPQKFYSFFWPIRNLNTKFALLFLIYFSVHVASFPGESNFCCEYRTPDSVASVLRLGLFGLVDPKNESISFFLKWPTNVLRMNEFSVAEVQEPQGEGRHVKQKRYTIDLSARHLESAIFSHSVFNNANFEDAHLAGADFSHANLTNANFKGAHLENVQMHYADMRGAILTRAYLRRANVSSAALSGASLENAFLERSSFRSATLFSTSLRGANLRGADFEMAWLVGSDLSHANLRGAKLSKAYLDATDYDETDLAGATFQSSWLRGARFATTNYEAIDLRDTELWRTTIVPSAIYLMENEDNPRREEEFFVRAFKSLKSPLSVASQLQPPSDADHLFPDYRDKLSSLFKDSPKSALLRVDRLQCLPEKVPFKAGQLSCSSSQRFLSAPRPFDRLEAAQVRDEQYQKDLAGILFNSICSPSNNYLAPMFRPTDAEGQAAALLGVLGLGSNMDSWFMQLLPLVISDSKEAEEIDKMYSGRWEEVFEKARAAETGMHAVTLIERIIRGENNCSAYAGLDEHQKAWVEDLLSYLKTKHR